MAVRKSLVAVLLLLSLSLATLGLAPGPVPARAQDTATPPAPTVEPIVALVQRVGPAVVTVVNLQTVQGAPVTGGFDPNGELQPAGSGTGFIISADGYIVTNWHVVTGGSAFQVTFADGETRDATLVGADEISDLAVVRVEGEVPATVALGDSDALLPGQAVVAIGSPLGEFTNTVTEGIVGATGRDFPGSNTYTNLIQHDAAINPGNSGGPLFNLSGEVVGVNTLGIPAIQGQPVQGLFFAIPSNEVRQITDQLIASGEVIYPYLGVSTLPVTPAVAAQQGLPVEYGAYVGEVSPGGPAEAAGIQVDDIIVSIAGRAIDAENAFTEVLFAQQPGQTVAVVVQRGEEQVTVDVTLGERPDDI